MKVGLYFGSFNPIHVGHLIIANHLVHHSDLDQIWMVVSPHNPLKKKSSLLADHHRLALVYEAVAENDALEPCDVEFKLEQPNYTVKTLAVLKEKHSSHEFSLIMGEDNLRTFHKWYNYEKIIEDHKIFVYPRVYTEQELTDSPQKDKSPLYQHPNITFCKDAPVMAISSSFIRREIKANRDVRYLLTPAVYKYIDEMNFYR